ncbi:DUF6891 domain-containing protein [Methanobrevibacter millerae]|uniref:DUF6891 domain-containing protein n=1 Tax=Methanobrevibacter millerae TaxID=230361 RepID=A0A0U2L6H7_9EURY|nr:hypothetical protein [Methanobrevibacter millerae]ALT69390.1 hypothetical protein sm9_1623 [Methanobrevibacter millerae]
MNQDLVDEIEYMIDLLTKSGFFSQDEILEILEDQFIEYEIDFSEFDISPNDFNNNNFSVLEKTFKKLSEKAIICVHNCGYDFKEGVDDIYELYVHLINNKYSALGFCFYTFEDVEQAIERDILKLTFGDFQRDENKSLEIGEIVYQKLIDAKFKVNWDNTVNSPIEIINFKWDKKYSEDTEYEIEGAYELFTGVMNEK